jgi:hypothetical protein
VSEARDEAFAKALSPGQWQELAELGRQLRRRLGDLHEQLRPMADALGDEHAELRDEIRSAVLPGVRADIDDLRRHIRRAELLAEASGRHRAESRRKLANNRENPEGKAQTWH